MYHLLCFTIAGCLLLALTGCDASTDRGNRPPNNHDYGYDQAHQHDQHDDHHHHHHAHDHTQLGPHEGHLVELGDEQYHIEWVHDDATGRLTLYVLDRHMQNEVPITASSITIDIKIGDNHRQHVLAAVEPSGDDPPRASRFETTDPPLIEALKLAGQGVEAQLVLEIEGESFQAKFEHHAH